MIIAGGQIKVVTPGTPIQATANLTNPTARLGAQSVTFQAAPGNAGITYIGLGPAMVRATGVGVLASLAKPSNGTTGPFDRVMFNIQAGANGFNASDFWIDADSGNDIVIVTIVAG